MRACAACAVNVRACTPARTRRTEPAGRRADRDAASRGRNGDGSTLPRTVLFPPCRNRDPDTSTIILLYCNVVLCSGKTNVLFRTPLLVYRTTPVSRGVKVHRPRFLPFCRIISAL